MLRLLIFLVGMLSTRRPGAVPPRPARDQDDLDEDATWFLPPRPEPPQPPREPRTVPRRPGRGRRQPRIPRTFKWAAVLILAGPIFRKAIVWVVLTALGATLHLVGVTVPRPTASILWSR